VLDLDALPGEVADPQAQLGVLALQRRDLHQLALRQGAGGQAQRDEERTVESVRTRDMRELAVSRPSAGR
jgi:hypothetical protein